MKALDSHASAWTICRELSVELKQMKAELWQLGGFNQAEALACCTVVASVARGFWAAVLMGTLITGLSLTFNTVPPTVPVTVSGNKTRLWGNTLRHNVINLVGKQSRLPYRNGCQLDSRLHVIHTGVTKADSLHIRACSFAPADIYSICVTSVFKIHIIKCTHCNLSDKHADSQAKLALHI